MIDIEVAFAIPNKQMIIPLSVSEDTKIIDAINQSGIAKYFSEYNLEQIDLNTHVGIFGKKINVDTYKLQNKDRIEIYRKLMKTPNQRRLERAK